MQPIPPCCTGANWKVSHLFQGGKGGPWNPSAPPAILAARAVRSVLPAGVWVEPMAATFSAGGSIHVPSRSPRINPLCLWAHVSACRKSAFVPWCYLCTLQFVQFLHSNKPIFVGLLKTWPSITAFGWEWDYLADEISNSVTLGDDMSASWTPVGSPALSHGLCPLQK